MKKISTDKEKEYHIPSATGMLCYFFFLTDKLRHLFLPDKDVIEVFVERISSHHVMHGIALEFPKHVHHAPSGIVVVEIAVDVLAGFQPWQCLGQVVHRVQYQQVCAITGYGQPFPLPQGQEGQIIHESFEQANGVCLSL